MLDILLPPLNLVLGKVKILLQVNESYAEQNITQEAIVNSIEGLEEGNFKILLS
jgi:hypothetical protein